MMTAQVAADEASRVFDIAAILDHGEWHPLQKRILILVSLVATVDGVDAQVLSLALPMIAKDWGEPRSAFAILMALSFVAMAIGTALGGLAGDRLGRKTALIGATGAFGVFTLAGSRMRKRSDSGSKASRRAAMSNGKPPATRKRASQPYLGRI